MSALAVSSSAPELLSTVRVAPSILSADYGRLSEQVNEVLRAGARVIHFDVMDGHFVPPITFGPIVVAALSELVHEAGGIVDVQLMIERPERQVGEFARAGADLITVHVEATAHIHYALDAIKAAGCLAGLAINPGTSERAVAPVTALVDHVQCMTVNPGWGGQRFIAATWLKLNRMREILPSAVSVQVDGGGRRPNRTGMCQAGRERARRRLSGVRRQRAGRRLSRPRGSCRRALTTIPEIAAGLLEGKGQERPHRRPPRPDRGVHDEPHPARQPVLEPDLAEST